MTGKHNAIQIYGTTWCPDCKRAKQFLGDQRIHYHWIDIEKNAEALLYVEEINDGKRIIPTIIFPDDAILVEPSNAELADKLGITTKAERTYYDVVIVGGGPAGLTAGMYTAREGLETLIIEKAAPGGQAGVTQIIDNFPGFVEGISGDEFAERLTQQAKRFGVEILQAQAVTDIRLNGNYREVITTDESCYAGKAVLIATGAHYRRLDVPGEAELIGINVHFCATCDGAFYKDKQVIVIGGGNSALEESLFLTRFAEKVTVLARGEKLKASKILIEKVDGHDEIDVILGQEIKEFRIKDNQLESVVSINSKGQEKNWFADGVFVFIGMTPNSDFLPPEIKVNPRNFIQTDTSLQTSLTGIFAAGDVRSGATAQAASAAGEGASAALMMRQYLESLGDT